MRIQPHYDSCLSCRCLFDLSLYLLNARLIRPIQHFLKIFTNLSNIHSVPQCFQCSTRTCSHCRGLSKRNCHRLNTVKIHTHPHPIKANTRATQQTQQSMTLHKMVQRRKSLDTESLLHPLS